MDNYNQQLPEQPSVEQQPQQPVVQTPIPPSASPKSKLPLLLIIFIFLIIIGGGVYLLGTKNNNQPKQTTIVPTTVQNSPTPTTDVNREPTGSAETANWKTYIDNYYQIKYPDVLYTVKQNVLSKSSINLDSVSFNSKNSTENENSLQDVLPITITVSNFDNQRMSLGNPKSLFGLTGNTSYAPNSFIESKSPQTYSIDSIGGYIIYDIGAGVSGLEREIVVVKDSKIYDIQTDISYVKNQEKNKKLVDQILSTFKFTQ